jgi:PASTA domain
MRQGRAVSFAVVLALIVSTIGAAVARAGELPVYDGAMTFPEIKDPTSPEDYSWEVELQNGQTLKSVSPTEAEVDYQSGHAAFTITAEGAHDAYGTDVPTTLEISAGNVITLVVHHREGPYVYPVTAGSGWEGGYQPPVIIKGPPDETELREMREAEERSREASTRLPEPAPFVPAHCTVPSLHGLSLKTAKAWLRAAHCGIGGVHLAAGATTGKGRVVKQFDPAGTQREAGSPVAVKLGASRTRARAAVAVASSAGEGGDSAEIVNQSEGGTGGFPNITGPEAPEEYPVRYDQLSPQLVMRQVDDQEIVVEYKESGIVAWTIKATLAHDAVGATVPTTVSLTEGNVVTLTVHYRAGNPAAGGAPFAYPITEGKGWEGGYRTTSFEMNEPKPPAAPPEPAPPIPCTVPSLHGLSLKAAKARLRAANCTVGQVRLAAGATAGKGKVVKQFRPAGTQLGAGTPVAVKLGLPATP